MFRQRKVTVTAEGLVQEKQRFFHDNHEDCVFPILPPVKLETYEQLLEAPEVASSQIPSGWMVIGEDNGFFPYSTKVIYGWDDIENRQHRRLEYQDVGRQNAELRNIKRSLGNPLLTTFAMLAAAVIALMVLVGATAMLLSIFNNKDGQTASVLVPALLGAVAVLPRRRSKEKKVKAARKPVDPLWCIYLYCTVTGRKSRYALPFSEVAAHIPQECWRYPVRTYWRRYGAVIASGFVFLWMSLLMWASPSLILILIPAMFIAVPAAGVLGFFQARSIMYKFSWFNRPYCKVQRFKGIDDEGNEYYFLEPMRYTGLTGVDPMLWDALVNKNLEEAKELAIQEKLDQLPQFDPIVNRADDAYEDVTGLLEREDTLIPMSGFQKIQLGSLVTIAGASVFAAFFIVMATLGG